MKKLLETSLGHMSATFFSRGGRRVDDEDAIKLLKTECNPCQTGGEGVIVYMSREEFERYEQK